eukprot:scaffold238890_cov46-Cyclotella_meneghiniana.AAC.1
MFTDIDTPAKLESEKWKVLEQQIKDEIEKSTMGIVVLPGRAGFVTEPELTSADLPLSKR